MWPGRRKAVLLRCRRPARPRRAGGSVAECLLVGGDPGVDQLDHGRNALRAPGCPSTPFYLSPNPVVNLDRMAMDLSRQFPRDPIGSTAARAACLHTVL